MPEEKKPTIIFFDGVCNLCDSFVNFVWKRDLRREFLYAPLQGETARKFLKPEDRADLKYLVLLHEGRIFRGARAVQEVFARIYPKRAWLFRKIPGRFLYKIIAQGRYRIFGKKTALYEPSPEQKKRFLP